MHATLLTLHSVFRWLALASLGYAIYRSGRRYAAKAPFSKTDNAVRHWTATIAHIQLLIGMLLYFQSPAAHYFRTHSREAMGMMDTAFFGLLHPLLMLLAILAITIGSSLAKRRSSDRSRFHTMLIWFSAAMLVILVAIPWPFSPLASRPYLR